MGNTIMLFLYYGFFSAIQKVSFLLNSYHHFANVGFLSFFSPLSRSKRTAEIIWGTRKEEMITDSDLREIDLYSFQVFFAQSSFFFYVLLKLIMHVYILVRKI